MDIKAILLVILIATLAAFIIVLHTFDIKRLYTFNDVKYDGQGPLKPFVYDLTYVSNTNGTWSFLKNENTDNFVFDIKKKKINYLLIKGNLYKIDGVQTTKSNVLVKLVESCSTVNSFIPCNVASSSIGNAVYSTLHVIGYLLV